MSARVAIGRVCAPHGVRGWLRVEPLTDDPERFEDIDSVFATPARGAERRFDIEDVAYQPRGVLLKLEGIDDREAAGLLKNVLLRIPEELVPPAGDGEYYYYQLEGMRVETHDGEHVGTLEQITRTGSNDVYWVRTPDGKDHKLVPALKTAIKSVDVENRLMIVYGEWIV